MNEVVSKNISRSAVTSRSYRETLCLYNSGNGILQDEISRVFSNFLKALFSKSGSLGQTKTADKFSHRTTFAASRIERSRGRSCLFRNCLSRFVETTVSFVRINSHGRQRIIFNRDVAGPRQIDFIIFIFFANYFHLLYIELYHENQAKGSDERLETERSVTILRTIGTTFKSEKQSILLGLIFIIYNYVRLTLQDQGGNDCKSNTDDSTFSLFFFSINNVIINTTSEQQLHAG